MLAVVIRVFHPGALAVLAALAVVTEEFVADFVRAAVLARVNDQHPGALVVLVALAEVTEEFAADFVRAAALAAVNDQQKTASLP